MFETTTHDFGSVARNAKAEYRFVLKNLYLDDVHVSSARPSCWCIRPKIERALLKTYEEGAIVAVLNTKAARGRRNVTITVTLDRPSHARVRLHAKAYIRDDVVVEPDRVTLGATDQGTPVEKTIVVRRKGRSDWRVADVQAANPHLSAEVVRSTHDGSGVTCEVRVRLDPDAPAGPIRDHLMLITNEPRSQGIPVLVEGKIVPEIAVSPASLFLGVLAPGQQVTKQVVVRGKRPFRVTVVRSEGDRLRLLEAPLSDASKPLHVIPLTFAATEDPGKVQQTIRFETDLPAEPPELVVFAVVKL